MYARGFWVPRGDFDSESALTRRRAGSFRRIVNCAPAKCCVWPVIAPAEASVRAGGRSAERAVLLGCLAFGSRLSYGSVGMSGVRFTPSVRFCWDVWRSVHACLFSFVRKRETACGILRSYSAGSRSPLERSRIARTVIGLCRFTSGLYVSLGRSRRGYRGRGELETGLRRNEAGGAAFVRLCAGALALQVFPRGVRWGLRAPKPAPKSHWLSGLSSFDSRRECASRGEGLCALRGY